MKNKFNIIETENVRLLSSQFNMKDLESAQKGGSLTFSCEVQIEEPSTAENIQLLTKLFVSGENENESLFELESSYISEYTIVDIDTFSLLEESEKVEYLLSLIFSIIREDSLAYFSRAGLRQIQLPYHFNSPKVIKDKN